MNGKGSREGCCLEQKEKKNSQGRKDPGTIKENSQGRDPNTLERNSQGEDPRTLRGPVEWWRVQGKKKEVKWKKKKRKVKKKKVMKKCKERIVNYLRVERKDGDSEKKRQEKQLMSPSETCLGKVWKMALSITADGAEVVVYGCCSGRFTEKDKHNGKNAATRSSGRGEK